MLFAATAAQTAAQATPAPSAGASGPIVIAVPFMPTPAGLVTQAGSTEALGRQVAEVVANDLAGSGSFDARGPEGLEPVSYVRVTAPDFRHWSGIGAGALAQGFVEANPDGSLTVGCYLYDVAARKELTRQGFLVQPAQWRRAAHKCADTIYSRLTGEDPYFDSSLVYVAEGGPKHQRTKRLAIMDQDGANHRFLTGAQSIALTPRFAPDQQSVVYMSYAGGRPGAYIYDLASGQERPVVDQPNMTFAPRYSPNGRSVVFSMAVNGNTDVYRVPASGGPPERLTDAAGIDTGGSYSPDGSKIVFESDRGGSQQLYVMNSDGSGQRRISFGDGRYGTPVWSPKGDLIAFTRMGPEGFRIGVMTPEGGGEKILTRSWQDEG
ncbi:MAG TPA: Tol-Pal system beta propeller repeat protein TolB, partial [Allosphingosinicella sp.]|nr:Tol-Pal system beta propeller repeat protein TolB [Allosphingosinicella sp.]